MEALIIIANTIALIAKGIFYLLMIMGGCIALFVVGGCLILLIAGLISMYMEKKENKNMEIK
ncbi:MAG: hypothetical protein NC222_06930 [Staphylococcus sp.]|nr:hypothetical protein [Staphylococcus sp.]